MATRRTDPHSPSKMMAGDYEYKGFIYIGSSSEIFDAVSDCGRDTEFQLGMKIAFDDTKKIFKGNWKDNQTCDHCGHIFANGAVYYHKPTGEHIVVGWICAGDYFDDKAGDRFRIIKRQGESRRRNMKKLFRKKKILREYVTNNSEVIVALKSKEHRILENLRKNLNNWGSLSKLQGELAIKISLQEERKEIPKTPVVEGKKVSLTGNIISFKEVYNNFSYHGETILKMLVEDDRGFRVYGTAPSSMEANRGDKITFVADVQRSKDDESFGFFKRPRKCEQV